MLRFCMLKVTNRHCKISGLDIRQTRFTLRRSLPGLEHRDGFFIADWYPPCRVPAQTVPSPRPRCCKTFLRHTMHNAHPTIIPTWDGISLRVPCMRHKSTATASSCSTSSQRHRRHKFHWPLWRSWVQLHCHDDGLQTCGFYLVVITLQLSSLPQVMHYLENTGTRTFPWMICSSLSVLEDASRGSCILLYFIYHPYNHMLIHLSSHAIKTWWCFHQHTAIHHLCVCLHVHVTLRILWSWSFH